jgi:hypothetical protein
VDYSLVDYSLIGAAYGVGEVSEEETVAAVEDVTPFLSGRSSSV